MAKTHKLREFSKPGAKKAAGQTKRPGVEQARGSQKLGRGMIGYEEHKPTQSKMKPKKSR